MEFGTVKSLYGAGSQKAKKNVLRLNFDHWAATTGVLSQFIKTKYFHCVYILGAVIMGIGSLVFVVPHFIAEVNSETLMNNKSEENICRLPHALAQDMALGQLSPGIPPSNLRPDNCIKVRRL